MEKLKPGQVIFQDGHAIFYTNEPGMEAWTPVMIPQQVFGDGQDRAGSYSRLPQLDNALADQIAASHIRQVSDNCVRLVEAAEGLRLAAYTDPVGIPTIGIGTTRYPDGRKVKLGDTCTREQAYEYCRHDLAAAALAVDELTRDDINQHQFDALTSFVYNVGRGNYAKSTLRKVINDNPRDPAIRAEFARWNKAGGSVLKGLVARRKNEADLYFR